MALTHYVIGGGAFQEAIVPSSKRTTSEDDVISRVTAIPEMWSLIAKHGVGEEPVSSLLSLSWAVRLMVVCKAARVGVKEGLSTIKTFNCSEQLLDTRFCSIYARASSKPRPSLPAELLQRLSGLKFLWLDSNSLTSVPADIGGLSSLTALYLRGNNLTSVPTEFGQLSSLKKLDLSKNNLTTCPLELGRLSSLITLDLSHNMLTALPAELGRLSSLTTLYLQTTKRVRNIWPLNIGIIRMSSLPAELGQLSSLTRLHLPRLESETVMPAEWKEGGALERAGCIIER
eukprot:CAMPEP_0181387876 /NCGR_PEP_ID=MMETSP1106-20121128/23980_1 /TAXON_ID=81844 /ORGANISM="Mantoniella antarctica, Strain SL-175" /LENGTH=286 /DNA_ID=CAMNT_0023508339 /DNA_START=333 /DNA_END=1189 /DNA_ORIENTATION=-